MKTIFSLCFVLITQLGLAQHFVVKHMNYMFSGIENELKVSGIENLIDCKIFNDGRPIKFNIKDKETIIAKPQRATNRNGTMIYITNPKGETILSQRAFVKRVPDPVVSLLGQKNGMISTGKLSAANKLDVKFSHHKINLKPNIGWFELLIIKKDGTRISLANTKENGGFSDEIKKALSQTSNGDILIFGTIKTKLTPKSVRILNTIVLTVK